jgi:DNA polymerase II small subunit
MQDKIKAFLKKGLLLSPELLDKEVSKLEPLLLSLKDTPIVFDSFFLEHGIIPKTGWEEYEKLKVEYELGTASNEDLAKSFIRENKVNVLESYEEMNTKITIKDFVFLYNERYLALQSVLRQRQELTGSTTLRKIYQAQDNEQVSFIGIILDISLTKNNHIMLTLEDQTGTIKALANKSNKEVYSLAKDLTPDEVIGVQGTKGDKIVFINNILIPDIPLTKEFKKSPADEAAVFISDIHIGSKAFLESNFNKFIEWIKGNVGTLSQRELVKKIKYLFIIGDIVEGIGIYPEQEKDLSIRDIYEQYSVFTKYVRQIPTNIKIIICPGNHDTLRIAEPQPALPKELVPELYEMENISFVSSPSIVNISQTDAFSGFDVLLYHGFSFPYYGDAIESIRQAGGLENTDNIMVYLLKKRHLAPTHGSTQYQLGYSKDPLVIRSIPDFFVSGHIHRASTKNYKNITLLNSSCWISQTEYQEKRGLTPQPCRAIYIDLKTRESKILNFEK